MRVLVCGSRTFYDWAVVYAMLDGISEEMTCEEVTIIEGAARGADTLAASWAERERKPVEAYPADWQAEPRRAGYIRNQQMLDEGQPDLVVAFVDKPLPESKGTAMMVDLARKAGVKTIVVEVTP